MSLGSPSRTVIFTPLLHKDGGLYHLMESYSHHCRCGGDGNYAHYGGNMEPNKTFGSFQNSIDYREQSMYVKGEFPRPVLSLVQFSHSVMSNSLRPHGLQHTRPPCPSPTPRVYSNSCPLSRWCYPTISTIVPFSSCLQSFPASGSFPRSQFLASDGKSIGVSASTSVLPMNIQDWFPFGWTGWISVLSRGLSRVFSNTTVQKNQFFGA